MLPVCTQRHECYAERLPGNALNKSSWRADRWKRQPFGIPNKPINPPPPPPPPPPQGSLLFPAKRKREKKKKKNPALQKPWRSELCLWIPTVARVEEEQWIMGAPMQNERKYFSNFLPSSWALQACESSEFDLCLISQFLSFLAPDSWTMATASRSPAAAGGDAPANNDSSADSVARHYLDCALRILRETMCAHVWLDYECTTMILFNGIVWFFLSRCGLCDLRAHGIHMEKFPRASLRWTTRFCGLRKRLSSSGL